ncbi:hypothetical protein BGW41_005814 [Actinomortierella wolfii]|nr:hypothetical protein BGW41_005814 [Actinomortierella wolfii]
MLAVAECTPTTTLDMGAEAHAHGSPLSPSHLSATIKQEPSQEENQASTATLDDEDDDDHTLHSTTLTSVPIKGSLMVPNPQFDYTTLSPAQLNNVSSQGHGPSSAPSSPTIPSSFLSMHGSSPGLYEPLRRNSVPILSADQTEHKRKASEEKYMQRQGSWSGSSTASLSMINSGAAPPPVLHHLDAAQLDPATMHYYRTQLSQPHLIQQQQQLQQQQQMQLHTLGHMVSSPTVPSTDMTPAATPPATTTSGKVKRNNSICSTTSVSSSGSGSNNKHPCKFMNCGWSFKRYEHLKRHMLVHTKERPFVCDFAGCNKSFSRSDNFSAHLRTHTKKNSAHRRYESRAASDANIKQEANDAQTPQELQQQQQQQQQQGQQQQQQQQQPVMGGMASFMPHPTLHLPSSYSSGSLSQDMTEYREYTSPPRSPSQSASVSSTSLAGMGNSATPANDSDSFDMMNHSGYGFGSNGLYPLDHQMDHINGMMPRFDSIRFDFKSVAPGDIHKPHGEEDGSEGLMASTNPNGESPHPSPMPQYEHFSFPSSISTHFMPMFHSGFTLDAAMPPHHPTQNQLDHHDGRSFAMTHGAAAGDHYTPSPAATGLHDENPFHNEHGQHVQPLPGYPQNYGGHPSHELYDPKSGTNQVHPYSVHASLPPHPLMSTSTPSFQDNLYVANNASAVTPSTPTPTPTPTPASQTQGQKGKEKR